MLSRMPGENVSAPDGLRPGQLGVVVLGRVILGDIAATLVDLAARELLRVEPAGQAGWQVTSLLAAATSRQRGQLLGYEQTLLAGVAVAGEQASLPALVGQLPAVLDKTKGGIIHDAVRHGWLKHLQHAPTAAGEELAQRIGGFRQALVRLKADGGEEALEGPLLPYALHFQLVDRDRVPLGRFAHAWLDAFAHVPGWGHPAPPKREFDDRDRERTTIEEMMRTRSGYGGVWVGSGGGAGVL
jgi:hypothetical protein